MQPGAIQHKTDYGLLALRLVIAWRLIGGTILFVPGGKKMNAVISYFNSLEIPFPEICTYISVYAQFVCGILFALGLFIRPAAIVMIANFTVAIIAAHLNDPIGTSFAAWAILAASLHFLFAGAGRISLQKLIEKRRLL